MPVFFSWKNALNTFSRFAGSIVVPSFDMDNRKNPGSGTSSSSPIVMLRAANLVALLMRFVHIFTSISGSAQVITGFSGKCRTTLSLLSRNTCRNPVRVFFSRAPMSVIVRCSLNPCDSALEKSRSSLVRFNSRVMLLPMTSRFSTTSAFSIFVLAICSKGAFISERGVRISCVILVKNDILAFCRAISSTVRIFSMMRWFFSIVRLR